MYEIGEYIYLKASQKTICSRKEQNGYKDQYFKKEEVRFQVLYIDEERRKIVAVADKPTEQKLYLQGKEGYENGVEEMDRICKEISRNRRIKKFDYWRYRKKQILGRWRTYKIKYDFRRREWILQLDSNTKQIL